MLRRRNKKDKPLSMEHYAPKITFTALDYFLPFSYERYMKEAEARIKETLSKTERNMTMPTAPSPTSTQPSCNGLTARFFAPTS